VPLNLDAICAHRPEHAARVRELATPIRPYTPPAPVLPPYEYPATPTEYQIDSERRSRRMRQLWANPEWRQRQMDRLAEQKARFIAQWEATYGRPFHPGKRQ